MQKIIARYKLSAYIHTSILIALAAVSAWALLLLMMHLLTIWRVRISGDLSLYFSVGRGLLNHLKPYADLFEDKPPGIFFLSALSLALTGDNTLYSLCSMLSVLGIVAVMVLFTFRATRRETLLFRVNMGLAAFLLGVAIAIYTSEKGSGFQPEIFGAFFGVLYVLTIAWDADRMNWKRTIVAGLCIAGSIGMKEPFVLSLAAAAMLTSKDWNFFVRAFVLPLLIAFVTGVVMMLWLGYPDDYLRLYLPAIFHSRLPQSKIYSIAGMANSPRVEGQDPLWLRGLDYLAAYEDMPWYAPLPLLGPVIAAVWVANPVLKSRPSSQRWIIFGLFTACGLVFVIRQVSVFLELLEILHFTFPWQNAFFVGLITQNLMLLLLCICAFAVLFFKQRPLFRSLLMAMVALYLATLAAAVAGEFGRHVNFAIPAYVACCFVALRAMATCHEGTLRTAVLSIVALALVLVMLFVNPRTNYAARVLGQTWQNEVNDSYIATGRKLDAVMSRCGFVRYLSFNESIGSMRHSPYDLAYPIRLAMADEPNTEFRSKLLRDLAETDIVVFVTPVEGSPPAETRFLTIPEIRGTLDRRFSAAPPTCAGAFKQPVYWTVLFRKANKL